MYSETGDLEKAEECYQLALKIRKEQLGANLVDVAASYDNLGNVYSDTGDLGKAKEYQEWALNIKKEQLGANHVDVAASYAPPPHQAILASSVKVPFLKKKSPSESISSRGRN